jgi:hypothetical protein
MPAADKVRLAALLHSQARALKASGLRAQHPDWSEAKVQKQVRDLFLYGSR